MDVIFVIVKFVEIKYTNRLSNDFGFDGVMLVFIRRWGPAG